MRIFLYPDPMDQEILIPLEEELNDHIYDGSYLKEEFTPVKIRRSGGMLFFTHRVEYLEEILIEVNDSNYIEYIEFLI